MDEVVSGLLTCGNAKKAPTPPKRVGAFFCLSSASLRDLLSCGLLPMCDESGGLRIAAAASRDRGQQGQTTGHATSSRPIASAPTTPSATLQARPGLRGWRPRGGQ